MHVLVYELCYEMRWHDWYNLWFASMFNEYNHVISCVFLNYVRRGPPLEPMRLSAMSDRGHLCLSHSLSMRYVYVIYEMRWQMCVITVCMWYGVTEFANIYSMYIATWSNRGVSTTYWAYIAQPSSIYLSCRSRKSIRVCLEDKWERYIDRCLNSEELE